MINNRHKNETLRNVSGSLCDSRENKSWNGLVLLIFLVFVPSLVTCTVDLKKYYKSSMALFCDGFVVTIFFIINHMCGPSHHFYFFGSNVNDNNKTNQHWENFLCVCHF